MTDRNPIWPGRIKITPVPDQENTFDVTMADGATVQGTPYNKDTMLRDSTAAAIGLTSDDPVVSEALEKLATALIANGLTSIFVKDEDGNGIPNIKINGIESVSGGSLTTDANGRALGVVTSSREVTFESNYIDIPSVTVTVNPDFEKMNTVEVLMPFAPAGTILSFETSGPLSIYRTAQHNFCLVGGGNGGGGGGRGREYSSGTGTQGAGGTGGTGGKVYIVTATVPMGTHDFVCGSGGLGGPSNSSGAAGLSNGGSGGDTTFLSFSSANGDVSDTSFYGHQIKFGGVGGLGDGYTSSQQPTSDGNGANGNNGKANLSSITSFNAASPTLVGGDGLKGGGGGGGAGGGSLDVSSTTVNTGGNGGRGGDGYMLVRI